MNVARHAAAKEIFLTVVARSPRERSEALAEACGGDRELRAEVESLLSFSDPPVSEQGVGSRPPAAGEDHPFRSGAVFAGRYRLVAELGSGGMGLVWRARDLVLDQEIALKVLAPGRSGLLARLIEEVRLARRVSHPNVCRVFDFGEAEGRVFLTMEYIDGEDLRSLLSRIGRLPAEKVVSLAHQLCAGLAAAHGEGIVHRDLKPSNLMVDGRGRLRITDFGLATPVGGAPSTAAAGTPGYLAPELLRGEPGSVQSDLWAAGLILWEMATGEALRVSRAPGNGLEDAQTLLAASPRFAEVDPRLGGAIRRCLAPAPTARPSTAIELARLLPPEDPVGDALAAGLTPSPEAVAAAPGASGRWRAPGWLALGGGLALLLVALLADRAFPGRTAWRGSPPEHLVVRAAETLEALGHRLPVVDRAWGFRPDPVSGDPSTQLFWYRQSPDWFLPADLDLQEVDNRVGYYDPWPVEEGSVQMLLSERGRLVTLKVFPAELSGDTADERAGEAAASEPDWAPLLAAVGWPLDTSPVEPRVLPPFFADRTRAWALRAPDGRELRLEAASLGSRVVFADVRPAGAVGEEAYALPFDALWEWTTSADSLLWAGLALLALLHARRNLRRGRADRRGARRFAALVAAAQLLRWAIGSDHVPLLEPTLRRFVVALGLSLTAGLLAWIAYLAVEPTARRFWPRCLVGWSRLLRGRVVDREVALGFLAGAAGGAVLALWTLVDRLLVPALGLEPTPEVLVAVQLDTALGPRSGLAALLLALVEGACWAVLGLFLLAVLRRTLQPRRAVFVWVLMVGAYGIVNGAHPAVSWLTVGVVLAAIEVFVLVRYGLLAYAVALFGEQLLVTAPLTVDLASWTASAGLFAAAIVAGLGGLGIWLDGRAERSSDPPGIRAAAPG